MKKNKEVFLCCIAFILILITFFLPSIPQPLSYHDFADKESIFHIPNAFDVLSNVAILLIGLFGVFFLFKVKLQKTSLQEKILWGIFFVATFFSGILSFYYHWHPNNFRLAIERIALAFLVPTFLSIMIIERISKKVGFILAPFLILFSIVSVLYWAFFDDLRLYGLLQIGSALLILVILFLFKSNLPGKKYLYTALIFYTLSKIGEGADKKIYDMLAQTISGHTLKHLFSAAGALALIGYLNARRHDISGSK